MYDGDDSVCLNINLKGYSNYIAIHDNVYKYSNELYKQLTVKYGDNIVFNNLGNSVRINGKEVPEEKMGEFYPYILMMKHNHKEYERLTRESPYKNLDIDEDIKNVLTIGIKRRIQQTICEGYKIELSPLISIYNGMNFEITIEKL